MVEYVHLKLPFPYQLDDGHVEDHPVPMVDEIALFVQASIFTLLGVLSVFGWVPGYYYMRVFGLLRPVLSQPRPGVAAICLFTAKCSSYILP